MNRENEKDEVITDEAEVAEETTRAEKKKAKKQDARIAELEKELAEAKYKAMSSSSELTERCRESHLLMMLQANNDSLIRPSELPPYKINIPEE